MTTTSALRSDQFESLYSHEFHSWCVYKRLSKSQYEFMYDCQCQLSAQLLATALNEGKATCRAMGVPGNPGCGTCPKCLFTKRDHFSHTRGIQ